MKRVIITLITFLMFSSLGFASFPVQTVQQDVASVSTTQSVTNHETTSATMGTDGTMAIVLALVSVLFLPFGLHNWYLGRNKQALWQTLMVFPGFILILPAIASWIWQVVDLIRLLSNGGSL